MTDTLNEIFSDITYLGDVTEPSVYRPNYHNIEIDISKHVRLYIGKRDNEQHLIAITPSTNLYTSTVIAVETIIRDGNSETSQTQDMLIAAYNVAVGRGLIKIKNNHEQ